MMPDKNTIDKLVRELKFLRSRLDNLQTSAGRSAECFPSSVRACLSPAVWRGEVFAARITADNGDGTYQARRQVAGDINTFIDDDEDTDVITAGNVSERGGYTGALSVDDLVLVRFDGLTAGGSAIYHVWFC